MKRFKTIVVGVDLSWIESSGTEDLSAPNAEAVRQAPWLAKLNAASVHFLGASELSASAQQLLSGSSADESIKGNEPEKRFAELVAKAWETGSAAESRVTHRLVKYLPDEIVHIGRPIGQSVLPGVQSINGNHRDCEF